MKQPATVRVQTTHTYRDYADFLFYEIPVFLKRILGPLGLRYRREFVGSEFVGSEWNCGHTDHWIEKRFLLWWKRIAVMSAIPGDNNGLGYHKVLKIQVLDARYLTVIRELAQKFERTFGLRTEVSC